MTDSTGADPPDRLTILQAPIPEPPATVLVLRGAANHGDERVLRAAFIRAALTGLPFIVDLGSLEHADEILLGLLLTARTHSSLHLVGPLSPALARRLDVTGTRDVFRIHPTLTAALAAITAAGPGCGDDGGAPSDRN
ncbi:STAS domain-containing protein [Streptomyces sp. NPDC002886]|uniref:STAS domain-containing protein n=1 Tax=Streptomyces sp. NPDC002886 TaxID=3364667 RepID=UPI00369A9539